MNNNEIAIVHRVSIARSEGSARPVVNTASCRLCGEVLERKEGPLKIGLPGLYAVSGPYAENAKIWRVVEPLAAELQMCTTESVASIASAL